MTREQALELLNQYITNKNLRKHMLAVEAAMRRYAQRLGEDAERWGLIGLLHDLDYEKHPHPDEHPWKGADILRKHGFDEDFVKTVIAHASHTNEPRDTLAKKVIFAVDELTGFIVAVALVKPQKSLEEVDVKSVKKKMKDKAFARQVNRDEIRQGAEELDIPLDEHIKNVLDAMQGISDELGL